jgi:glycosyltransferase involved in cell wall biosynthesis
VNSLKNFLRGTGNSLRALYISTTVNVEAPVSALQAHFDEVLVFAPWSPSMKLVRLLRSLKMRRLARVLFARIQTFKHADNVRLGWLGIGQFFPPLCNHLKLNRFISVRKIEKITQNLYLRKIQSSVSGFDLIIIPSDLIDLLERCFFPTTTRVVVEIRWHHLSQNELRPTLCLDFPTNGFVANSDFDVKLALNQGNIDAIITYSEFAANSYQKNGILPEKILIVPISIPEQIDTSVLSENSTREKTLLYVGRSAPDKGLDLAIHVAVSIGADITVIGSMADDVVSWLRLFPNVTFLGILDKPSLQLEMMRHKVFLSTGIESFGMALVEALTLGMSVVGTQFVGAINWYGNLPQVFSSDTLEHEILCDLTLKALASYGISQNSRYDFQQINAIPYWSNAVQEILRLR